MLPSPANILAERVALDCQAKREIIEMPNGKNFWNFSLVNAACARKAKKPGPSIAETHWGRDKFGRLFSCGRALESRQ